MPRSALLQRAIDDEKQRRRPAETVSVLMRFPVDVHERLEQVKADEPGVTLNGIVVAIMRRALGESPT